MFYRLSMSLILLFHLGAGCSGKREAAVEKKRRVMQELINIGDDIFESREKLTDAGFKIIYGPEFPTKEKSYYLMIVDFGVDRNLVDRVDYIADLGIGGKPIHGAVWANGDGRVTKIE